MPMSQVNKKIIGPVIPLPTAFTPDYQVDHSGMSSYVDFLCKNGIGNLMTTVGTSRFNLLSWEEIEAINETVVKAAAGRAVTMVANPPTGGLETAKKFAGHAESIGADFLLLIFPERYYGEENTYDFFAQVADSANINILIHEMPMRNGLGGGYIPYSLPLLHKLMEIPNIVGLKEEALDMDYSKIIMKELIDKAVIIGAGGGMSRYLKQDHALGATCFLGGLGNFIPQLELQFFDAIGNFHIEKAKTIVNSIELPYFEKIVPIGWHPALKAALSLEGLMGIYERPPMKEINGQELSIIQNAIETCR